MDELEVMKTLKFSIFDDNDFAPEITGNIENIKKILSNYIVKNYSASGFDNVKIEFKKIDNNRSFNNKAKLCSKGLDGIAIFDLCLADVDGKKAIESLSKFIGEISPVCQAIFDEEEIFDQKWEDDLLGKNAGMILACLAAKAGNNTADIYIGSSHSGYRNIFSDMLVSISNRKQESHNFGNGILQLNTPLTLQYALINLVDKYFKNRGALNESTLGDIFWPKNSRDWFASKDGACGKVPHNFDEFISGYKAKEDRLKSPLGEYLLRVATCFKKSENTDHYESLVFKLLSNEAFYDVLKSFVGNNSLLGSGKERPKTSALILPLLAALGGNPLVEKLLNELLNGNLKRKICFADRPLGEGGEIDFSNDDKDKTKRIFVNIAFLFSAMHSYKTTISSIQCKSMKTFDFLSLEWTVNPVIRSVENGGARGPRHPLLTLTQYCAEVKSSGTMKLINAFQDACKPIKPTDDRCVYAWFLPGVKSGTTELRIGVANRD